MDKEKVHNLFDEVFKYKVNQELRHRGDSKSYSADMGLFVLGRVMSESSDDDGNVVYERLYTCRLVKFSGSGERGHFSEKELMTIEEYNTSSLEKENERNRMRSEMRKTQKEVYGAFGVSEESYLYLKNSEGITQKDRKYSISGFSIANGEIKLSVREAINSLDGKVEREAKDITSKEQFELVN